jgi:hypothetical protein
MPEPARRLVIAGGATGTEAVFEERALSAAVETESAVVHELVELDAGGAIHAAGGPWHHDPGADGAILRTVRLRPVGADQDRPLHGSPTIDIGFVLAGSVELTLPGGTSSILSAGDSFVLRGVDHAWTNRGPADCELAVLLLQPSQWSVLA